TGTGDAASPVHHNCSGKHAGILAMCVHLGIDHRDYLAAEHPAQRRILAFCGRLVDEDPADMPLAVDGCGIPVFATTLRRAARAFARMATLQGAAAGDLAALRIVRDAMAAEPAYVGGTTRFDTALIATTAGRIVGKAGAEGVHGDALRREGLGLVFKVIDGARRAVSPAAIALLNELGALEERERVELRRFAEPAVYNAAGRTVGGIGVRMADTIPRPRTS
ncbi:MAG: asparaginase, partial [Candidatus Eremiobacteraeota bacterium]|nr:asparaginase [Candidatus Eremiobacteraeota bacterium]